MRRWIEMGFQVLRFACDIYDYAVADTVIGLFKTDQQHHAS